MRRYAPRLAVVSLSLVGLLLVVALALVNLFATASDAAPVAASNGATQDPTSGPINVNDCQDDGSLTFCYSAQGEYHGVCASAGNCTMQTNLRSSCFSFTDDATGDTTLSVCGSTHYQIHTKPGESQVFHYSASSIGIDPTGSICTSTAQFHAANGRIQYDNATYTCTGPSATPVA